jgi:hypothetical protein
LREVKTAIEKGDRMKLAQYGRFLQPLARQLSMSVPATTLPGVCQPR